MAKKRVNGIEMLDILGNRVRILILGNLHFEKGMSISKIHELVNHVLGENYDYKTIFFHIKILEEASLITLEKQEKMKGRPVYVKLKEKVSPIEIRIGDKKYKVL